MPEEIQPHSKLPWNGFLDLFNKETDRGAAIIATSWIDAHLTEILETYLLKSRTTDGILDSSKNGAISSLSTKAKVAYVLGLISKRELQDAEVIATIRNKFAHRFEIDFSFEHVDVARLCQELTFHEVDLDKVDPEYRVKLMSQDNNNRGRFLTCALHLHDRFIVRIATIYHRRVTVTDWNEVTYPRKENEFRYSGT